MKSILLVLLATVLVLGVVSCGSSETGPTQSTSTTSPTPTPTLVPTLTPTPTTTLPDQVQIEYTQSDKQRVILPTVNTADLTQLVEGNSSFAFDLYKKLSSQDGNLFYSPYSISMALAMAYAGARSETEQQMADTLHFILSQEYLHAAFNALDQELATRGEGAKGKDDKGFRLNIANAIWGQKDYEFLASFLDVLAENYGSGLNLLDFIRSPEESRVIINDWVSEKTEGKIKDLIPQGAISELTRLVLTNAIYFNAAWSHPFEEKMTEDGIFYLLDGNEVTVPMMEQTDGFGYTEGDGYKAVELPYDGNELSMIIMAPDEGQFEKFEGLLDYTHVTNIIDNLAWKNLNLSIPKFEIESAFGLKEALSAMGMPVAFSGSADFSGITSTKDLTIGDVIHKAFVSVDEAGTEAAAATAVVMEATGMPAEPLKVTIDRPFIFLIRDIQTGAILFIGRVVNPSV